MPAKRLRHVIGRAIVEPDGATAAEYALLLGILGGSLALASFTLGDRIGCSIDRSAATIAGQGDPGKQYGNSDPNGLAKGHRANC